jgi:2-iminoacetate synthase
MRSLRQMLAHVDGPELTVALDNGDPGRARRALCCQRRGPRDLALLLSPGADHILEEMAEEAHRITLERFGKTMQLYAPLYLSNRCAGRCPYCGFSAGQAIQRRALTIEEIAREAALLREAGMQSILLVSGDDPRHVDVPFLARAIEAVMALVPSVSLEVAPLPEAGYAALAQAGADGVTLYQETYDRERYADLHRCGPKADFDFRLEALSRAGGQDFCKLTVGALWGLSPWRREALSLGLHAAHLQKRCWRSHVSVGLPRLRQVPENFHIPAPLGDRAFVLVIVALRIFLPDAGLVLSTRERPDFRDRLVPLGITQMSAGSRTHPGGYGVDPDAGEQFEVADRRAPSEIAAVLTASGYEPVWKNWDRALVVRG